jgi:hypothetical protein
MPNDTSSVLILTEPGQEVVAAMFAERGERLFCSPPHADQNQQLRLDQHFQLEAARMERSTVAQRSLVPAAVPPVPPCVEEGVDEVHLLIMCMGSPVEDAVVPHRRDIDRLKRGMDGVSAAMCALSLALPGLELRKGQVLVVWNGSRASDRSEEVKAALFGWVGFMAGRLHGSGVAVNAVELTDWSQTSIDTVLGLVFRHSQHDASGCSGLVLMPRHGGLILKALPSSIVP